MSDTRPNEPLAIVGIGCLFPGATDLTEFWANVRQGRDAIGAIPESHWSPADYHDDDPKAPDRTYGRRGGFLSPVDFDPLDHGIAPNAIEATDTSQLLTLMAARAALADAGYGPGGRDFDRERVSVLLGVTGTLELVIPLGARLGHPHWRRALRDAGVDAATAEDVVRRIADAYVPWQENSFPGLLGNVVAGRVANRLDLHGTNCVVDAACASSLSAVHLAGLELNAGRSDMVVTGGVDTFNDIFMYMCFSKTPALSPTGHARPFDRNADGTTLGEGIGVLVLKRLADAERDGDTVYCTIRATGSSSDGKGNAIYAPAADGQQRALRRAYELAGVGPESIELIEAHGTGTAVGDATEVRGLCEVFGEAPGDGAWCALGSVKSQIGHTKAAAGVAGLIKAALALHHKVLPPTIKVDAPPPALERGASPFYVNTEARPWLSRAAHPRRAGVSSFGFGGSNFHCLLEEHAHGKSAVDWDGEVQIVPFAADSPEALLQLLDEWPADASWDEVRRAAAELRRAFRNAAECRLVVVAGRDGDLAATLDRARKSLRDDPDSSAWSTPDGTAFGRGAPGRLAWIFPGQGSQRVGMLRQLACRFPEFLKILGEADRVLGDGAELPHGERLSDRIYPPPAFDDATRAVDEDTLRATDVAQPALGAVSLAAARVLERFGVRADASAGHSYGELPALAVAGRIDERSLHLLSYLRGRLMADAPAAPGVDGRGTMLAAQAELAELETFLESHGLDLVIANRNAPRQAVLSGSVAEIERAEQLLTASGLRSKRLPVAAAFHSRFVASAREPFAKILERTRFAAGSIPVHSNTTAELYPDDPGATRDLLAEQLTRPVEFVREVEGMHASGVRTFVEVGPGARLGGLIGAILEGRPHDAISLDASSGRRPGLEDLARLLARLAALGHGVDLAAWEEGNTPKAPARKPKLVVPICGANYRAPRAESPARQQPQPVSHEPRESERAPQRPPTPTALPARPTPPPPTPSEPPTSRPPALETRPTMEPTESRPAAQPAPPATRDVRVERVAPPHRQQAAAAVPHDDHLLALQQLQEQTARLHQQFLEGQEAALRALEALMARRDGSVGPTGVDALETAPPASSTPVSTPPSATAEPTLPLPKPISSPPAPVSEPAPTAAATPALAAVLMEVVAEKTGYPVEVVELDMELEGDLGIDSIKRVEILSALQERLPGLPAVAPEELGTLHTLRAIVALLESATPAPPAGAPEASAPSALSRAATPAQASTVDASALGDALLEVVAEKTGYPRDVLELDMELEGDLGIDSIKRVEILSALQERLPGLPAVAPEELGTLHTLRAIVALLESATPAPSAGAPAPPADASIADASALSDALLEVVAEKTGYPRDVLELDMELEGDLGIDSIKRVEILSALQERHPALPAVAPEELGTLHTLRAIVALLESATPAPSTPSRTAASASPETPTVTAEPSTPAAVEIPTGDGGLAEVLLDVVAEKTGYPRDVVELDMHLESDLGIDSIKRVEILSAVQERLPGTPVVAPEQLGALQTLRQIIEFLGAPEPAASAVTPAPRAEDATPDPTERATPVAELRRSVLLARPLEGERQALELLVGAEVWVTQDGSPLTARIVDELNRHKLKPRVIPLDGLPKSRRSAPLGGLIIVTPASGVDDSFLEQALWITQIAAPGLRAHQGSFLATVSRLDGAFGLAALGSAGEPISGALAGLTKTAALEWPEIRCKALDVDPGHGDPAAVADAVVDEALREGPVEVGLGANGRMTPVLEPTPLPGAALVDDVDRHAPGEVIVVSGGARGVTAECALALARRWQPTLVLLGRSELAEEPEWLATLVHEAELKRAIVGHATEKLSPKDIERRYRDIVSAREVRANLERLRQAGAGAVYRSLDVRDASAVRGVLAEVREEFGPIRALIHGAGVLADQRIEDKTHESFDRVYGTKVEGLRNLLAATEDDPLWAVALFSSTTARYGRAGQVDYAMANEVLNKLAHRIAAARPDARVVSINWGPWDGGMVTPALKSLFENENIGLIPLVAGAELLADELSVALPAPVEVTVLAGSDPEPAATGSAAGAPAAETLHPAFERTLHLDAYPFLESHVIDGRAVLPMAMIIEWLAHGALHGNPGFAFHGFDDLRVFKGVILGAGQRYPIRVVAGRARKEGTCFAVPVELRGRGADDREVLHARASIILASRLPEESRRIDEVPTEPYPRGNGAIYREVLFHGPAFQGLTEVESYSERGIVARARPAPSPAEWLAEPLRSQWLADPLVLDCSFQLMILWSQEALGAVSLPCFARSYRQYRRSFPVDGTQILIRVTRSTAHQAFADIEFLDGRGQLVARIEDYECVVDASLEKAFRSNRIERRV